MNVISRGKHFDLCEKHPEWLEFNNLLLARSFALLEQRMVTHLHTTAQERFESLLSGTLYTPSAYCIYVRHDTGIIEPVEKKSGSVYFLTFSRKNSSASDQLDEILINHL